MRKINTNIDWIGVLKTISLAFKDKALVAQNMAFELESVISRFDESDRLKEYDELIYVYSEGFAYDRLERIVDGRCSLAEQLRFDMGKEEKLVEKHIRIFAALKRKYLNDCQD